MRAFLALIILALPAAAAEALLVEDPAGDETTVAGLQACRDPAADILALTASQAGAGFTLTLRTLGATPDLSCAGAEDPPERGTPTVFVIVTLDDAVEGNGVSSIHLSAHERPSGFSLCVEAVAESGPIRRATCSPTERDGIYEWTVPLSGDGWSLGGEPLSGAAIASAGHTLGNDALGVGMGVRDETAPFTLWP